MVEAGLDTTVTYLAIYANGETGAPPPHGGGHGGNDGDMTDDEVYEDTWMVSPGAPTGQARVQVVAGRDGGYASVQVPFLVADPTDGGCP